MKSKKRKILSIVLVIIIVVSAIMFFMWKHLTNYNTTLEANWEISIPSKGLEMNSIHIEDFLIYRNGADIFKISFNHLHRHFRIIEILDG